MYNYKSRWDMIKKAWTDGIKESERLELSKDYHNWSPLLVHCYHSGLLAGMLAGILLGILLNIFVIFLVLLQYS